MRRRARPLDSAATATFVRLLARHGIDGRAVSYAAARRETIGQFDPGVSRMICISSFELGGDPPHLRYLIERLRHRPSTRLTIGGLWPGGEALLKRSAMRRCIRADHYTSSFSEAVRFCIAATLDNDGVERKPRGAVQPNMQSVSGASQA